MRRITQNGHGDGRAKRRAAAASAALAAASVLLCAPAALAQISLSTAVDLALRSSPRVRSAQAEVERARAALAEAHDVYIPSITMGAGLGQAYGYLPNPPTLFTLNAGALVYSGSQKFYIRSSYAGLTAAEYSLEDARAAVAEETAEDFLALDRDQQREAALGQQAGYAERLVAITQDRLDAGQDTRMSLTQSQLTAAQIRLARLRAQDELENDRERLARMLALPPAQLQAGSAIPAFPGDEPAPGPQSVHGYASASVAAAFASADARRQQARGDSRVRFWPQVNSIVQYNRYATFTDSFNTLKSLNPNSNGPKIGSDEAAFGVQIVLPFFDKERSDKARESAAEAAKALHDAETAQLETLNGQGQARHAIAELKAQAEVASLEQQLAQSQLEVVETQLKSGGGAESAPTTPKEEQKARIDEREKYLAVLDANYQLQHAEIQLLRQNGQLEQWLRSPSATPPATSPATPPTAAPGP